MFEKQFGDIFFRDLRDCQPSSWQSLCDSFSLNSSSCILLTFDKPNQMNEEHSKRANFAVEANFLVAASERASKQAKINLAPTSIFSPLTAWIPLDRR